MLVLQRPARNAIQGRRRPPIGGAEKHKLAPPSIQRGYIGPAGSISKIGAHYPTLLFFFGSKIIKKKKRNVKRDLTVGLLDPCSIGLII